MPVIGVQTCALPIWVIVDDYEVVPACKAAITDFLARRNLSPTLHPIDGVGVFFQKA